VVRPSHAAHSWHDWQKPGLVVDRRRRIVFANPAMAQLLGRDAQEIVRTSWPAGCVPAGDRPAARALIDDALRGTAREGGLVLATRDGRRVAVRLDLQRVGRGKTAGVVVLVGETRSASVPSLDPCDAWCEVTRAQGQIGRVRKVRFLAPSVRGNRYVGRPLIEFLDATGASDAADTVRQVIDHRAREATSVSMPDSDGPLRVVTASAVDDKTVVVVVRCVDLRVLPDMLEAKVARVGEKRGLSDREQEVLQLLLRGRGAEDIGTLLGIAPRTVKFHQANVLQKLGADSRSDLLRVLL
jgi:PAS domain S-box-containing protein